MRGGALRAMQALTHPVEQILERNADIIEPKTTIIYAIETHLVAAVCDAHSWERLPFLVPDWHQECVKAFVASVR